MPTIAQISRAFFSDLVFTRRIIVLILLLVLFPLSAHDIIDPDFGWHLRTGQYIVETRTIPHADIYSYTNAGKEWVTHEWLSEILMYGIYQLLGVGGLIITFSIIITAALWITYLHCAGQPLIKVCALFLGAVATIMTWGVRPQMITFLFISIYMAVLSRYARGDDRRMLWWLPPLMILWVNLHGGFASGLALIALWIVGLGLDEWAEREPGARKWERLRPLALTFFACLVVVPLNPNGVRMFSYPFETLTSSAMQAYLEEWQSPNFHFTSYLPLALLIFATFSAMALSKERVHLSDLLLLSVSGYAALRSLRNIPFFALVAIPLLAKHASNWITAQRWGQKLNAPAKREKGRQAVLHVALLLIVAVLSVLRIVEVINRRPTIEKNFFPRAAVEFIRTQRPPGPIFNSYSWGGYLIQKLYPEYRVFIDGRADVYGDAFMDEYMRTERGKKGWQEPLDRFAIRTVMTRPDGPLASLLRQDVSWSKIFEDDQAVIFTKQ